MVSIFNMSSLRWTILIMLLSWLGVMGKPTIDSIAILDPQKIICTAETMNLCQRCAKQTKSEVVYPWCCANHEGVQEWCKHFLDFGL